MNSQQTTEPSANKPRCEHCSTQARCLFATLRQEEHAHFWAQARERSFAAGEPVEIQGGRSERFGVVKVGLLKGMRRGMGGTEKPIVLLGKGRLIGFTQIFGQPTNMSVVTITPTRICEVDVQAVKDIAMLHQPFQHALYRTISEFMSCMGDWAHLLRQESYLIKVCVALHLIAAEEGSQSFRIPSHTELASVLGARRETVARHITLLIEKGLFKKVDRWHGVLTSPDCSGLLELKSDKA